MSYMLREKKERKKSSRYPVVDKSLYLPYVSDDMTPEEIMKKFEALEEFQRKKAEKRNHNEKSPDSSVQGSKPEESANEVSLDDSDLMELCDQIGTVFDEKITDEDDAYEDHDFSEEDEDFEFDSDISEDETKRQKGRSGNVHLYFTRAGRLIETVSSKALSRKCYQLLGPPESPRLIPVGDTSSPFPCEYIKIPASIPLTWTHTIQDFVPPTPQQCILTADPLSFDYSTLQQTFNMVYVNTPSDLSYLELERLQLSRRVVPAGFVFVWADKESIPAVLSIFERKGFFYVENLVWVRCHDEDTVPLGDESSLLRRRKRTLLILRRGRRLANGSVSFAGLDLRHQRNPDVVIAPYSVRGRRGERRREEKGR
ncbi:uncharacterized protein [Blastocystis hominis]|uniref:Uncharacterized protein n=1 Tax=Blastocystis hominis TaxID=12968 RepID=D8M203_BLAHO|nr:uncharacterized protein [Blastocystis hominis]CBK22092.2 unnamed protein product [Blastocystis hominis]|eukprot:XP_012896140.1 uncharacterized protein [Blastocystis hominis]